MSPNSFGLELLQGSQPAARVAPALVVTSIFGVLGFLTRGVTLSGALAGTIVAFLIWVGIGFGGFVTLFCVFAITWLTTRIGYTRKRQLGLAEDKRGRKAGQVLANVAAAAVYAVLAIRFGPIFAAAAIASLAEAAADTASSEIGEVLSGRARLITTFRSVPAGRDGAISIPGTLASVVAAALVVGTAVSFHVVTSAFVLLLAAFLGTLLDSWLGATVERVGWVGNNTVNAISTSASGIIAIVLAGR